MKHLLLASLFLCSSAGLQATETSLLQQIIDGDQRSTQHKNRDQYRHPKETLDFFELNPKLTVVEIWPGGKAWYTEILAPYLKDNGKLYAAHFSADSEVPYFKKSLQAFNKKIIAQPEFYNQITITTLQPPNALIIAPKASVDRVLTFRNIHNWMKNEQAGTVFKAMYEALKQGGILGIVEHRALTETIQDPKAKSGYVTEATVMTLAENAGFKFIAKSEINANPNDNTIHPKGVWTLPPTLRLKDQDREKYLAIGESDRMTLKFIKP